MLLMIVSPSMLSVVPEWALYGAAWAAVGVFLMVSLACYALRRVMAVPGSDGSRVGDVIASVSVGGVCAVACASAVVAAAAFGVLI